MSLNNCESNLILTLSSACIIANSTGVRTFAVTDTKLYVPFVALSTQGNAKLWHTGKPVPGTLVGS